MSSLIFWVVLPGLLLSFALAKVVRRGFEMRRLVDDGVPVTGVVRDRQRFRSGPNRRPYLVYEYADTAGRTYTHRSLVPHDVWQAHDVGSNIDLVRSASRPEVSAPAYLVEMSRQALAKNRPRTVPTQRQG